MKNYLLVFICVVFFVFSCKGTPNKNGAYDDFLFDDFYNEDDDIEDFYDTPEQESGLFSPEQPALEWWRLAWSTDPSLALEPADQWPAKPMPALEPEKRPEWEVEPLPALEPVEQWPAKPMPSLESAEQRPDSRPFSLNESPGEPRPLPALTEPPSAQQQSPAQQSAQQSQAQQPTQQSSSRQPPVQQSTQQSATQQRPAQQSPAQQSTQQSSARPLGPAEERSSVAATRESFPDSGPSSRDSRADAAAREQNVSPAQSMIVPPEGDIVFSRIVRATVGQMIEIPFNGTGWVYLGELASRGGIVYNSRRLDPEGQSFIFRAEEAGIFALKFFKQDFIRDYILNDHIQVIVGDAPSAEGAGWFSPPVDRGRVVAQPRWPSAEEEAQILRNDSRYGANTPPVNIPGAESGIVSSRGAFATRPPDTASPDTRPPLTPGASDALTSPDTLTRKAKETFDSGNVAAAIALLDLYEKNFGGGTDELYWLYGQFYEANSPSRNILLSLDYYRRLVVEFPQSARFNDARNRIAYLERFYINIR